MATRTRANVRQSAIPLSNLSPSSIAVSSQIVGGPSARVNPNAGILSQSGRVAQAHGTSLAHAGPTTIGNSGITGNVAGAGSAGSASLTAVPGSNSTSVARPKPKFWEWVQRTGSVLGILGTFIAIIYFFFPYQASLTANNLATSSNTLSNIANDWTRWAQCTAPGSIIVNATWCREHPTPDTFDSGFNMVRRSMKAGLSHGTITVVISIAFIIVGWIVPILYKTSREPKLSSDQLEQLLNTTNSSKEELNAWYKGFLKNCPSGVLSKEEFQAVYHQLFPFENSSSFASHVFRVFDGDGSGSIDFWEFIYALSVASRGKLGDKTKWAFRLYDINDDGEITVEEMLEIVRVIYEMVGLMVKPPEDEDEDTPEKRVEKIFHMMDRDQKGTLDMEKFTEGFERNANIMSALSLYGGIVWALISS